MSSNPAGAVNFAQKMQRLQWRRARNGRWRPPPKFFGFFSIIFGGFLHFFAECKSFPSVALGEEKKRKRRWPSANDVKSFPSASTALGKAFSECTIFGTRERRLCRMRISRRVFPECCTRGRLPRVQLGLPRVQPALGESSGSCSATTPRAYSRRSSMSCARTSPMGCLVPAAASWI